MAVRLVSIIHPPDGEIALVRWAASRGPVERFIQIGAMNVIHQFKECID
jgi:hypothetical protein